MVLSGRWQAKNRAALERLLAARFDPLPIAILDWDGTCMRGDIADAVFHDLCRGLAFHFESLEFEKWVNELSVPTRIMECYEMWRARPSPESRAALRFELERARWSLHASEDDNQAWAWDAGAFVGWRPSAVREYTRRVLARELAQPQRMEILTSDDALALESARAMVTRHAAHDAQEMVAVPPGLSNGDACHARVELARGLRMIPEMQELASAMRRAGWQVYVLSASPQWEVEAGAERLFIPPQNVIGMRRALVDGCITAAHEPPCSWGDGKLDAYQMFVTRDHPPNFVAGDSVGDWTLLEWATDCALIIEPTRDSLRQFAEWKQALGETWLVEGFGDRFG